MSGMNRVPWRDRAAFNLAFLLEHYFPDSDVIKRRREAARSRVVEQLRRRSAGKVTPVERQDCLSAKDFRRKYLSKGIPVILENGAAGWPLARWSFDGFRQRYRREMIKLVQRRGVAADEEIVSGREFSDEKIGRASCRERVGREVVGGGVE